MATGYTAPVQDGTITDFPEFALSCARAFGALITMRDQAWDAEIPEEIKPDTVWHDKAINEAGADLKTLWEMSDADKERESYREWKENVEYWTKANEQNEETRKRYEAMLTQVRAWQPPTPDHDGLKTFMIDQLEQSIQYDCSSFNIPERQDPQEWWKAQVERRNRDIEYHTERRESEIERARERTEWIRQLRSSLTTADKECYSQ